MHSSFSFSEDKILCPTCIEPINLSINKSKNNNESFLEIEIKEFTKITCQKCNLEFSFLYCEFCKSKIFMKIHPDSNLIEYNGINGYNIKCPYKSCGKIFYFTICQKCKKKQKLKKFIKEGNIIICKYCNFQYIQVHTPIKYCTDISYMEKKKINSNFPSGIIITHKNEILYQKINCFYCLRPIVYASTKNHLNKYIEGQKVKCPYEDCGKLFNRIICPFCYYEIYINDGYYEMGSLIRCNFCKMHFGKIICIHCKKINKFQDKFKLGHLKCGFANCLKESNLVNCIFCKQLNIFDLNFYINGKTIKCGYCKNLFNEILCPYCRQINPFPLADFSFGKIYKCQYLTCMKQFQFFICPKCLNYSFSKDLVEGQKMNCDKCKIRFMNIECPFCKLNVIIYNSNFKIGQMIKCPNEKCGKIYSFISCSKCKKIIFSRENENLCGKAIKCPYYNCKNYTVSIICPLCKVNIIFENEKKSFIEGEDITCKKCKNKYEFHQNNEVNFKEIIYLKEIEGKTIDYGFGEVDENYLAIQELFYGFNKTKNKKFYLSITNSTLNEENNIIKNNFKEKNNLYYKDCIICHNNIKESVFYPCGHRCTCYNCAVITFGVTKKCPKCKKEATCIIKKVYE